tara:strand:- start:23 stop:610 length:588 start_codon:yes stop_codon:yes gene_type:complete
MAWLRNGFPQPDTGFTVGDVNYPARWIQNASQSERNNLNITVAPEPTPHDGRFSWGWKPDGTEDWKDLTELKKHWSDDQENTANMILSSSDWMVVKAAEVTSFTVPTAWTTYRSKVREACNDRQKEINAVSTAAALKAILTGPSVVTQNKKDSDGNDIEHTDSFGKSYEPKQYEQEVVGNPAHLEGKCPWPVEPS